jgi:hypothetical protein
LKGVDDNLFDAGNYEENVIDWSSVFNRSTLRTNATAKHKRANIITIDHQREKIKNSEKKIVLFFFHGR